MKLEDEIKQRKFKNEHQKLLINILFTGSWLKSKHAQMLKPYDISPEQFNVLRILRGQYPNPSTVQLIIDRMLDKSSNASRIVEKLRQKGLVSRKECEHDRRLVDVLITQEGLGLLSRIDIAQEDEMKDFMVISEQDAQFINEALDRLRG